MQARAAEIRSTVLRVRDLAEGHRPARGARAGQSEIRDPRPDPGFSVLKFEHSNFEFASGLDIRISNFSAAGGAA